jgi:HYR domain
VNYTISTSDNSGVAPSVDCGGHGPGSSFSLGTTHVTCTATDGASNHASTDFDVTVRDTTKPTLNLPGNLTVEADSSAGKTVTYSATASDAVSGSPSTNCSPASGSTFPIGSTTVNYTATDSNNNTANGSFSVTVTDASGPAFSSLPGTVTAEANGPSGAVVNYTTPTAVDTVDGPQLVSCSPASHTLFPLGTTTVNCSAADNHGNNSSASFQVAVVDTTPPTLAVPGPTTVYATTPTGIPETAAAFLAFRQAATADDIVDAHPVIGDNLGSFAEVGTHAVGFVARDASGNATGKATQLIVLPMPPAGTPPLPVPPPAKLPNDVPKLQVFPGDGFVRLVWGPVPGAARYLVYRSQSGARKLSADGHGDLVYSGTATTYTDRGLTNGVEYRYVVVSQDAAGNQSAGVGSAAVPRLNLLRSPKDGARLKKAPKLVWARNAEASYYNVQLFRGETKILSTWPLKASLTLKRTWKYQGKRYKLTKGTYRWYVWPGFGARADVDYGELLGSNSFQMLR